MTWTKQHAGFYTLDDSDYAVASMQANSANPDNSGDFVGAVEWAVVRFTGAERGAQDGENVDWFDTMRDARAAAEAMAR